MSVPSIDGDVRDDRDDGDDGHDGHDDGGGRPVSSGWARIAVACGAVLALLLVGAAAGLLLSQSRASSDTVAPAPDSVAVGFSQDMSVHHRQAVRMAGIARDRSTDPAVKHLAFDIETNQIEQIGRMQGWLNIWGRDPQPVGGHMAWMAGDASAHGHAGSVAPSPGSTGAVAVMPGMATNAELTRLEQASGRDFDILFLQLMLRHHQGGLTMIRYAADHAEVGVVRNLAAQMAVAQNAEVDLLTSMLAERGATPLPAPS
jgi:uncharacterized protein (DUF305 family)